MNKITSYFTSESKTTSAMVDNTDEHLVIRNVNSDKELDNKGVFGQDHMLNYSNFKVYGKVTSGVVHNLREQEQVALQEREESIILQVYRVI